MTSLQDLELHRCHFTGTIPTELGMLSNDEVFYVHGQGLTGAIPSECPSILNPCFVLI